jgi:ABC-2 type transport system ATP-binding protein
LIAVFRTHLITLDAPDRLRAHLFGTGTLVQLAGDPHLFEANVRELPYVKEVQVSGDTMSINLENPDTDNPHLIESLVQAGAQIRYVQPKTPTLEQVYLELVDTTGNTATPA